MRSIMLAALLCACSPPPRLADSVDTARLGAHLDALQQIADDNEGNRAAFSQGYRASVDYVRNQLEQHGYAVREQEFTVEIRSVTSASLRRVEPDEHTYAYADSEGTGFVAWRGSPTSRVTDNIVAVDVMVPPPSERNTSTSGCEASDFAEFPTGSIALIQRGSCTFEVKVNQAIKAGASAVIIFNEGQPGRTEWIRASLPLSAPPSVPVLGMSYLAAEELVQLSAEGPVRLAVAVEANVQHLRDVNLIAETERGDKDRVVLMGAHLDSVPEGPGINDNASGSALVLETAILMAESRIRPRNKVRFAWWGAEEIGLVGSAAYVREHGGDEMAYLNFDMVGSLHGRPMHYAGTTASTDPDEISDEGLAIREELTEWFDDNSVEHQAIGSFFSSDILGFLERGVPSGGLFTGAVSPQDDCYHKVCDTRDNVNDELLRQMTAAASHAVQELADREQHL
ncbi:MAG: Zn-dependent M28 family amino/carboxypeptidase [Kiritimatiellia bacterium]|jgi:Zn-dependent M28 family amino/carboxypeptidase